MAARRSNREHFGLTGQCDCERASFAVNISDITCDGCRAEADCEWDEDFDFLHLTIAGGIEINGRVLRHRGRSATIGFFGQIHPCVIDGLKRLAA